VACYQSSKNANSVNILTGQHSGQGSVFSYDLTTDSSKAEHICSLNSGHTKTIRGALWNDKVGLYSQISERSIFTQHVRNSKMPGIVTRASRLLVPVPGDPD